MKPGDIVFNSLDKADKYYIVLKGRVCVLAPTPDNVNFGIKVPDKKELQKKETPK